MRRKINKYLILLITILISSIAITAVSTGFAKDTEAKEPTKAELEQKYSELKKQMKEHMQLMHKQMDEIQATEDKAKRQQLMREHERAMHESMEIMKELGGNRMLHEDREPGYRMTVNERLDYMQAMMEQMMRHLAAQEAYVK